MLKRLFPVILVLSAFALASVPAAAQMSDDAVVEYVKDGIANGRSQNEMAMELAAKGVTREQVERIRNASQAGVLTGNAARTAGEQERARRMNDGMMETPAVKVNDVLEDVIEPEATPVFGRNIFTNDNLTFAPSTNLPTPEDYRLGPGDEVIIDIWGNNQATIRQTISPDGTINIPDIGLVSLNGMTIRQADSYMKRKLGQIYSVDGEDAKSEIKLTLGNIRTIQVNLMGEVAVPGTYYLSSLSTFTMRFIVQAE